MKTKFCRVVFGLIFLLSACGKSQPEQPPIPEDAPTLPASVSDEDAAAPDGPDEEEPAELPDEPVEEEQVDAPAEAVGLIDPGFISLRVAQEFPFSIGNARAFAQFGEYGVIRVTGVLRNEFDVPLVNVAIRGNLVDVGGNLITTMETRIYNRILDPGENGLFDLVTMTADHDIQPGEYAVEITQWTFEQATDEMVALDYSQAVVANLESLSAEEQAEGLSYDGYFSVENTGEETAASVLIACSYGSEKNEILFITVEDIGDLAPGESVAYRCGVLFPADIYENTPMSARIDLEVTQIAVTIDALVK